MEGSLGLSGSLYVVGRHSFVARRPYSGVKVGYQRPRGGRADWSKATSLQLHFGLQDTAPGVLIFPPPRLNLSQHCPESAIKTPALQPEVPWHSAQQVSFEPAGRASSLDGSLQCRERMKSSAWARHGYK